VEELAGAPFVEAAEAAGVHLHGAGREDIDARMLGSGRPFVLEVVEPRIRRLDLSSLRDLANARAAGRVELGPLAWADRAMVAQVKETRATKRYRALVAFDGDVRDEAFVEALTRLVGPIEQRTPRRVSHRRADLVRNRRVHRIDGQLLGARGAEIDLVADGGLYVKELVSGDAGRTHPSLAELLGVAAGVTELDVMQITSDEFPDAAEAGMDLRESLPYSRRELP
jgi:tRNA pseudouridine synthase 10